jgi:hypothetical protein
MLADVPLTAITRQHLDKLVTDAMSENHRLDFKATLDLSNRDGQVELLRDITAMANADGGLLVFGVNEGSGEDSGVAVAITGLEGDPALLQERIEGLLRTSVDERISGVLQHWVPLENARFVHLLRVPASPLAPHMISNIKTSSARFFVRANTSNEPMTIGQIKDSALKRAGAVDRAQSRIDERVSILRKRAQSRPRPYYAIDSGALQKDQAVLHIIPLYPPVGGWRYEEPSIRGVLEQVPAFGYRQGFPLKFSQHGAFGESTGIRHVGFLRDGSLEFQLYDVLLYPTPNIGGVFVASALEESIYRAIDSAEKLGRDGFLELPSALQLHLIGIGGARFWPTRSGNQYDVTTIDEDEIATDTLILNSWEEKSTVVRHLLNHVWQAWGHPVCRHFDENGHLLFFNDYGQRKQLGETP